MIFGNYNFFPKVNKCVGDTICIFAIWREKLYIKGVRKTHKVNELRSLSKT